MGQMEQFQPVPPAAVSRVLATFDRDQLAGFIAVAIDLLDFADGDPDVEPNGDERGDQAWIEWHTMRGSQKRGPSILAGHEDDEDNDPLEEDDPSGQCDEDGINTGGMQFSPSGPGCLISDPPGDEVEPVPALDWGEDQAEGPLPISPSVDRRLMAPHRNYIRAERCERFVRYGESFYHLRDPDGLTRFIKAAELPG